MKPLAGKRILLANDDGINASGLKALEKIADQLADDVWVVAPETEQSGAGHSLTLTAPLRIRQISDRRFAVSGTPTDSVMMGVCQIIRDKKPDLVLSGVNRGANLGDDVTYSGTVSAAMEGTLLGIPSIALSQTVTGGHPVKWATAEHVAPGLIVRLLAAGWPDDVVINVNFPDQVAASVKGVKACAQGRRTTADLLIEQRLDMRSQPYYWLGFRRHPDEPVGGTDLSAIAEGWVTVTPLHLDLTHRETLARLERSLA